MLEQDCLNREILEAYETAKKKGKVKINNPTQLAIDLCEYSDDLNHEKLDRIRSIVLMLISIGKIVDDTPP